jgi:Uma2 family endonuclease
MSALLDLPEARQRVKRWSVKEYERLTELGAFRKNVELIRGIIVEKMSKSPLRVTLALYLFRLLSRLLPEGFSVRFEAPLRVRDSVPEPDISVVRGTDADFARQHPTTAALIIEVAVSNVDLDRENASLYAEAGVDEYWIVLPNQRQVEVYREPQDGAYTVLECSSVPGVRVNLEELFKPV